MPRLVRFTPIVGALALLAGCGGSGGGAVAHVGGEAISQKQLDALMAHFSAEAKLEGKDFPRESSTAFRQLQKQMVGLLVYRAQLRQAADRLGIELSDTEISKRLPQSSGGENEGDRGGDTYARDAVVQQLLYERIFDRVTRDVKAPTTAELSARRNRAMAAYVAKLEREAKARYEPGFAPGA